MQVTEGRSTLGPAVTRAIWSEVFYLILNKPTQSVVFRCGYRGMLKQAGFQVPSVQDLYVSTKDKG